MNAAEEDRIDLDLQLAVLFIRQIQIFRPQNNFDRLVFSHPLIDALKPFACKLNQTVLDHRPVQNIAFSDKISNVVIDWLIVDINGRSGLNDVAVVQDKDLIAHCQSFFLIVSHENKCDPQALLKFAQLILHVKP